MASNLQPVSQSQQLVTDLIKKLRHAFSMEATDQLVSQTEFQNAFTRVFTGVTIEKFSQIFLTFDEENKGTINYFQFLKEEKLSQILLRLHDESLSQITMLQQNSSYSDTIPTTDCDINTEIENDNVTMPVFPTPQNTLNTQSSHSFDITKHSSIDIRQSLKSPIISPLMSPNMTPQITRDASVTSLEHEVQHRDAEIAKLKTWITMKGLPAQESISSLKHKVSKATRREQTMKDEIKTLQQLNDSIKSQNIAIQTDNSQLETQYVTLQNEYKSFKNLWDELQNKYNECLTSYNTQKTENKNLNKQIADLNKLKNQYDRVNSDQNNKIEQLKKERDDFRDKSGLLELYVQDIIAENEQLKWHNQNSVSNTSQNTEPSADNDNTTANRNRSLSAVKEDTETAAPSFPPPIDSNAENIDTPKHPSFNHSTSFSIHSLDQIARRYSNVTTPGKRVSILERIRSQKAISIEDQKSENAFDASANDLGITPRLVDHESNNSINFGTTPTYSTMYGGRRSRRKKTISIISLSSIIPHHGKLNTMGTSVQSGLGMTLDNLGTSTASGLGDNDGYADQYDEFEMLDDDEMDEIDQLQEITEQLRMELQEEMEEELEETIASKYDLKILKLNTEHNEELVRLNRDIERLQAINRQQMKQLKMRDSGYKLYEMDEQKTNENGLFYQVSENSRITRLGDDMDDFNSNSTGDSESTYDDDADDVLKMEMVSDGELDEDDESDRESENNRNYIVMNSYDGDKIKNNYDDTAPLLNGEEKEKRRRKKKKKKSGRKKKDKRERAMEEKRVKEIKKSGFCCSSIFNGDEMDISSRESSPSKSEKRQKKRKEKDKGKRKKKKKDDGKRSKNKSKSKDKKDRKSKKDKDKKRSKKSKKKKHKKSKKELDT